MAMRLPCARVVWPRSCQGRLELGKTKARAPHRALLRGVPETPTGGRGKWLQKSNVQGVADLVPVSFSGCVGLAICATTINKDVPLRPSHNVQGVADSVPISLRVCVGLAICATTSKDVQLRLSEAEISKRCWNPPRLSMTARVSAFASNAKRRAFTRAAFA
jgi:hypothetical protein